MEDNRIEKAGKDIIDIAEELVRLCFLASINMASGKEINKQLKALGISVGIIRNLRCGIAPDFESYPYYRFSGKQLFGTGPLWENPSDKISSLLP